MKTASDLLAFCGSPVVLAGCQVARLWLWIWRGIVRRIEREKIVKSG